ncbi:hypothetical protein [Leucobacter chromiiresistens]|nr:hypothetical protein [Leucobacter chromiiresistens]
MKKFARLLIAVGMVVAAGYVAIVFPLHAGCFPPMDQCVSEVILLE